MLTRRSLLYGLAASSLLPGLAWADQPRRQRLVVVLLRGGLDGLAAVQPRDSALSSARPALLSSQPLALDRNFGLHPALAPLLPLWKSGELGVLHATGLPYQRRSHFDAQDLLENGTSTPGGARTGWLNRALGSGQGLAIGQAVPLLLRGDAPVTSADPSRTLSPDPGLLDRIERLYARDAELTRALTAGMQAQQMLEGQAMSSARKGRQARLDTDTAALLGRLLATADGPEVAVVEAGGWDTHTRQVNSLDNLLGSLATGLVGLKSGLGTRWADTVIVVVSEFGRTVEANGTGGTDHGVGGMSLVLGGAVRGKAVWGDWPGTRPSERLEGRDLAVTTDLRQLFKGVLRDHLHVDADRLEQQVFPDSSGATPLEGLIRV